MKNQNNSKISLALQEREDGIVYIGENEPKFVFQDNSKKLPPRLRTRLYGLVDDVFDEGVATYRLRFDRMRNELIFPKREYSSSVQYARALLIN